jgi:hypothetical protein
MASREPHVTAKGKGSDLRDLSSRTSSITNELAILKHIQLFVLSLVYLGMRRLSKLFSLTTKAAGVR